MAIITITRAAKCKDCIFLKREYQGRRKFHTCKNELSPENNKRRTLKDLVCNEWKLINF